MENGGAYLREGGSVSRLRICVNAAIHVGSNLPNVKPSKYRSRRQWKKIIRKGATSMYAPTVMDIPLSLWEKMRKVASTQTQHPYDLSE